MNLTENKTTIMLDDDQKLKAQLYSIVIPAFIGLGCCSFLANTLIICALRRSRNKNATMILITSLTLSDMWTISVVTASILYNSYLPYLKGIPQNICVSLILENFRTGGLITSAFHLLLIAVHHYIGIISPHSDRKKLKRLAISLCLISWALPSLVLFVLAFSFPNQGFYNCFRVDYYNSRIFRTTISGLLLVIFIVMTWCYTNLLCLLNKRQSRWRKNTLEHQTTRRERKILYTAILICSSYFLGWIPATILFAITCGSCELYYFLNNQKFLVLFTISCIQLFAILGKSMVNPLIYSCRIPEINTEIKSLAHSINSRFRLLNWSAQERTPDFIKLDNGHLNPNLPEHDDLMETTPNLRNSRRSTMKNLIVSI